MLSKDEISDGSDLAPRGDELASLGARDVYALFDNLYHPKLNPDGIVNLGVAENYATFDYVLEHLNSHRPSLEPRDLSYASLPWGQDMFRKAMTDFVNENFHPRKPFTPEELVCSNGVAALCEMLGFALFEPGDCIVTSMPCYSRFIGDFSITAKTQFILVPFRTTDPFSPAAVSSYEAAILDAQRGGKKVRALLLCNPHNPLGRCYPKETIINLMKLCTKYDLHLISDEIYALSEYSTTTTPSKRSSNGSAKHPTPTPFTSATTLANPEYISPQKLHLLYGLSKDFSLAGLRIGCLFTHNAALVRATSALAEQRWTSPASASIAESILRNPSWLASYRKLARKRLSETSQLARRMLDEAGIPYDKRSNAGMFLWLDLREYLNVPGDAMLAEKWAAEDSLAGRLMEKYKVFVSGGKSQQAEEPGFFRVVFSLPEKDLREGLRRLIQGARENLGESRESQGR